ncbi:hypothetical protein [Laspinema olomoucense]|nr:MULTISPECIES: hypothetical protein [unclassified Laspinema]
MITSPVNGSILIVYQMVLGMSSDRPRVSDRLEGTTGESRGS